MHLLLRLQLRARQYKANCVVARLQALMYQRDIDSTDLFFGDERYHISLDELSRPVFEELYKEWLCMSFPEIARLNVLYDRPWLNRHEYARQLDRAEASIGRLLSELRAARLIDWSERIYA